MGKSTLTIETAKEKYKELKTIEVYYSSWSKENLESLKQQAALKGIDVLVFAKKIYEKYKFKHDVLIRDGYECQSETCTKNSNTVTVHHIKFRRNKGKNKARNGVTLCRPCHDKFHSGHPLTIRQDSQSVFAGQTFREHKEFKQFTYDRKVTNTIRKENKPREKVVLSRIHLLMMLWFLKYVEIDLEYMGKEYKENKVFWDQKSNIYI